LLTPADKFNAYINVDYGKNELMSSSTASKLAARRSGNACSNQSRLTARGESLDAETK
jgi:hypothetical protein